MEKKKLIQVYRQSGPKEVSPKDRCVCVCVCVCVSVCVCAGCIICECLCVYNVHLYNVHVCESTHCALDKVWLEIAIPLSLALPPSPNILSL